MFFMMDSCIRMDARVDVYWPGWSRAQDQALTWCLLRLKLISGMKIITSGHFGLVLTCDGLRGFAFTGMKGTRNPEGRE
jgi:hypothetical protein